MSVVGAVKPLRIALGAWELVALIIAINTLIFQNIDF